MLGFKLPFYKSATLLLSAGLSARVLWHLWRQRPDVIHVSTPGVLCFAAVLYARLLAVPLVMSYHTHIPEYIPRYTWAGLVAPMWAVIRWCTRRADLTLVTSQAMKAELARNRCRAASIDVWQRGVDTDVFHPRHRSAAMRARMSNGDADAPLLVYVGRLGAEKNVAALKRVLEAVPGVRLALVGDGPQRAELEREFAGMPVKFMVRLFEAGCGAQTHTRTHSPAFFCSDDDAQNITAASHPHHSTLSTSPPPHHHHNAHPSTTHPPSHRA